MSGPGRAFRGLLLAICPMLLVLGACQRAAHESPAPLLFPRLAEQQDDLDSLRLRGAGDVTLVSLVKRKGQWQVLERGAWPADAGRISQYIFVLSQARRAEGKTADPALYPRLGVEPVRGPGAAGTELELAGGGIRSRLLVGKEHPKFDAHYVRVDGEARAWLTDLPVAFDRDPTAWIDHRLLDVPLARIVAVRVVDSNGEQFSLSHRDDRFRLDDAPSAAMRDSRRGDELASALDQLKLEDVAAQAEETGRVRELEFGTVDGLRITLRCRQVGERTWASITTNLDEEQAAAWFTGSAGKAERPAVLRARVAEWNSRFASRTFLLPDDIARTLWLDHAAILAGVPVP